MRRTTRQIVRETGVHQSSVYSIIRQDFKLKSLWRVNSLQQTVNLTSFVQKKLLRQFPASAVDFIFVADETIFSVAPPVNLQIDRSDCVYVPERTRKRDVAADHADQLLGTGPT